MSGDPHPDLALARLVAARASAVAGVAELDAGVGGSFATYRRGERQPGVRLSPDDPRHVRVRVAATSVDDLVGLGERVRTHVRAAPGLHDLVVDVHVSDIRPAAEPRTGPRPHQPEE